MGLPKSPRRGYKREPASQQDDLHGCDSCRTATWACLCCSIPGPISRIVSSTLILKVKLCYKMPEDDNEGPACLTATPHAGGTWTVVAQRIPLAASPGTSAAVRLSSASTLAAPERTAAVQPVAEQRPVHGAIALGLELQLYRLHSCHFSNH